MSTTDGIRTSGDVSSEAADMARKAHNRLANALMAMVDAVDDIQQRTGDRTFKFPNLRLVTGVTLRETLFDVELALAGLGDETMPVEALEELKREAEDSRAALGAKPDRS